MPQLSIILIDDHLHVHDAVLLTLEDVEDIELLGRSTYGGDAIALYEAHKPDVVLMDVVMSQIDGIEATRQLLEQFPEAKILVLSSYQDVQHVRDILNLGAVGYTLKSSLHNNLASAIRAVHSGNTVMAPEISQKLLNSNALKSEPDKDFRLTSREIEVLQCMARGLNNKEVGYELHISRSTVKFHISNIIEKMDIETRAEAIVLAARHKLI